MFNPKLISWPLNFCTSPGVYYIFSLFGLILSVYLLSRSIIHQFRYNKRYVLVTLWALIGFLPFFFFQRNYECEYIIIALFISVFIIIYGLIRNHVFRKEGLVYIVPLINALSFWMIVLGFELTMIT